MKGYYGILFTLFSASLILSCVGSKKVVDASLAKEVASDFGWDRESCPFTRINFVQSTEEYDATIAVAVLDSLAVGLKANIDNIKTGTGSAGAAAGVSNDINTKIDNVLKKYGKGSYQVSQEWFQNYTVLSSMICTLREDLLEETGLYTAPQAKERGLKLYERIYEVILNGLSSEKEVVEKKSL